MVNEKSEPLPLAEILEHPENLIGFEGDAQRQHDNAGVYASDEVIELIQRRNDLMQELQDPAHDTPEARVELQQVNDQLLSARADKIDIENQPPGIE